MPIGKDSIRKRVIGSDCAACGECTDKAPLAEKTTVSERAPLAGKAPAAGNAPAGQAPVRRSPGRPRKTPQTQTAASGLVAPAQSAPAPAQKPASAPAAHSLRNPIRTDLWQCPCHKSSMTNPIFVLLFSLPKLP